MAPKWLASGKYNIKTVADSSRQSEGAAAVENIYTLIRRHRLATAVFACLCIAAIHQITQKPAATESVPATPTAVDSNATVKMPTESNSREVVISNDIMNAIKTSVERSNEESIVLTPHPSVIDTDPGTWPANPDSESRASNSLSTPVDTDPGTWPEDPDAPSRASNALRIKVDTDTGIWPADPDGATQASNRLLIAEDTSLGNPGSDDDLGYSESKDALQIPEDTDPGTEKWPLEFADPR